MGRLIKNEKLGILSCTIILFYPVVFNQAKIYMLDMPLLSVIVLSVYFLIKSEYFTNKQYNGLFLAVCLAGLLIKLFFFHHIIDPFLYVAYKALRKKRAHIKKSGLWVKSLTSY